MKRSLIYIYFFLLCFIHAKAQESYVEEVTVDTVQISNNTIKKIDSTIMSGYSTDNTLYPKKFKENFRKKYQTEEFDYTITKPRVSLWQKLLAKINEWLRSLFGEIDGGKTLSYTGLFLRVLGFLFVGFILYLVISYLISKDGNIFFSKKPKKINIEAQEINEDIHEINFPEKILEFENKKEFRYAIRYHFLYVLKKLSDKKLIEWNGEKTNHEYLTELKSETQRNQFSEMIYVFEYVWYGEFEIDETNYKSLKSKFSIVI